MRTIPVTAGGIEYVSGQFEAPDHDISGDTLQLALVPYGTDLADAGWADAVNVTRPDVHTVSGSLLVDDSFAVGQYGLYGRLADSPEVVIRSDGWVWLT